MAITYKVLGQANPIANNLTTVYTVPLLTSAVVSTITVCNLDANASQFSIAVQPSNTSISPQHYLNYRTSLPGNDTITITIGITMSANDVISANMTSSNVSVNVFGSEIE